MLVKICGLTRAEDAAAAIDAGADFLGFIFVPGTPRNVDPVHVSWIRELTGAATVGVFRDSPLEDILRIRDALHLDWVQLHGNEPDAFLHELGDSVLRRVKPDRDIDWRRISWLADRCTPLIDPGAGDGQTCDWATLAERPEAIRFGLAGGLTPDNVTEAVTAVRPALVDVASGVEIAPGIKDPAKIADFVAAARRSP